MSKWVEKFESHTFHKSLSNLIAILEGIDIKSITNDEALTELARLKKVVNYIEKYIKIIDPDINILAIDTALNNINTSIARTLSELNNFIANKDIVHIQNANSYIDKFLTYLQQLNTVLPKITAKAISSMLKEYSDTLNESLTEINLEITKENSNKILKLKEKLLDGDDNINSKVIDMFDDMEEKYKQFIDYHDELLIGTNNEYSKKEEIENTKHEIEENLVEVKNTIEIKVEEVEEKLLNTSNKIADLNRFYIKIYGELNDGTERIGGLEKELETRITTLDNFEQEQQKIHKETLSKKLSDILDYEKEQQLHSKNLFEQIESLLPSATSAGLAKAYADERNNFKYPIILWNLVFVIALLAVSSLSYFSMNEVESVNDLSKSLLHTLPITAPLIWLALYSTKRRNENQRLEQEYAHKEALAKSYSSYKQQIIDLKQEDQELLVKLLNSTIDTISDNASKTLDKKHGDKTPAGNLIKDGFDEIKSLIKK